MGMCNSDESRARASLAKPFLVPSLFIDVNKISPAPRFSTSLAQSNKLRSVGICPPIKCTIHSPSIFLASIATVIHWLPNFAAKSLMSCGFFIAEELMETLSAPFLSRISTSSTDEIPPPTVNGIFTFSATLNTNSARVFRFSSVAEISKNTSSSAPDLA